MNILFLCHRIPYPPDKGDKIRACNILTHLAKHHVLHLAAFVDDPSDMAHAETLKALAKGECLLVPLRRSAALGRMAGAFATGRPLTTSYFASRRLKRWIAGVLARHTIDRAFVFSSAMAPFLDGRFDPARVVLDMVDVDSDKWRQYADAEKGLKAWLYRREANTLLRLERRAAATFGATLFVSPFEAATFAQLAPETRPRLHSVPNGVDLGRFDPFADYPNPYVDEELPIVMVGTMDYRPNVEGAIWFAERVLPIVRTELPEARFYVVGKKPAAELNAPRAGVVVTGAVDDVRPYLAHAAAVVAPLQMARGVQNKVLEGLAMRKPVVATVPATRGLDVEAGVDLWIEDEPERFAVAVIAAACGPDRERIAMSGCRRIEEEYGWGRSLAALDHILEGAPRAKEHVPARGRTDREMSLGEGVK